jgi:serine/threonine protein kinase
MRFSDVQLGDLGGAYPADSEYAKEGTPVGAPMWTSPEVIMETPWNTATDIWSFGTLVCLPPGFRKEG